MQHWIKAHTILTKGAYDARWHLSEKNKQKNKTYNRRGRYGNKSVFLLNIKLTERQYIMMDILKLYIDYDVVMGTMDWLAAMFYDV